MSRLLLLVLLIGCCSCRKPEGTAEPRARLVLRFLDRDAVLDLAELPAEGAWRWMNAGRWEAVEVRWKRGTPTIGAAVVGRTAPDWVLLEDPGRASHRVVMRGPGPEELRQRNDRMDPEDRDALAMLGVLWVLGWARH